MEQGSAEASWVLGRIFLLGIHIEPDLEQAKTCFENAQEYGYKNKVMLQSSMGDVYRLKGQPRQALVWYSRALANEQCPYIVYEKVGDLYRGDKSQMPDNSKALEYYLAVAEPELIKYAAGFYRKIGDMYAEGKGAEKNVVIARGWYAKARDAKKKLKKHMARFEFDPDDYKVEFDPRDIMPW